MFTKTVIQMKYRIRTSNKRVWGTTQLAKLRFNHSNGRTRSWRFRTFRKITTRGEFYTRWTRKPVERYRKRIQKFETTNSQKKLVVGIQIVVFRQITPEKDTQPIHKSIGPQVNLRNPNIYIYICTRDAYGWSPINNCSSMIGTHQLHLARLTYKSCTESYTPPPVDLTPIPHLLLYV